MFVTQRTPEWHKQRRGKLTASVAGAAIGVCSYQTPLQCMEQVVGDKPFNGNIFTEWGTKNEPNASVEYSIMSGNSVQPADFCVHPVLNWLGGSPDGFVDSEGLVEFKCPWKRKKKPLPDDLCDIPLQYFVQCQVLMEVTNKNWCDLFFWTPEEHRVWRFTRSRDMFENLLPSFTNYYALMARLHSSESKAWRSLVKADISNQFNEPMAEYVRGRMMESNVELPFSKASDIKCNEALKLPSLTQVRGSPLVHSSTPYSCPSSIQATA